MSQTTPTSAPPAEPRLEALDGLRGITILLVVVNHAGGYLWPRGAIYDVPVLGGFLSSGAVVIFFVVGAFIVTKNLLRDLERGSLDPLLFYARRLVRLGVHLIPLAVVIAFVQWRFPYGGYTDAGTVRSLLGVLTFTLNDYAQGYLFETRSDLGHLWYLSVQQQGYLILPLMLVLLHRRRWLLSAVLVTLIVCVTVWRFQALDERGWVVTSVMTTTRSDGLWLGVLLAVWLPFFRRHRGWTGWGMLLGCLGLLTLQAILPELGAFQFLLQWSIFFTLLAGVVVVAIYTANRPTVTSRVLSADVLTWLGRASLSIFVWHLPVILILEAHTPTWDWTSRTLVAVVIIVAIAVFSDRYIDGPVRSWLRTSLRPAPPGSAEPDAALPVGESRR